MRRLHVRGTSTVKVNSAGTELEDFGKFHLHLWRLPGRGQPSTAKIPRRNHSG
jgi:hypothetical protein